MSHCRMMHREDDDFGCFYRFLTVCRFLHRRLLVLIYICANPSDWRVGAGLERPDSGGRGCENQTSAVCCWILHSVPASRDAALSFARVGETTHRL
jgi:hypothetical protein